MSSRTQTVTMAKPKTSKPGKQPKSVRKKLKVKNVKEEVEKPMEIEQAPEVKIEEKLEEPVPVQDPYNEEYRKVNSIFPVEVWEMITLNNMYDLNDIYRCSKASPVLEEILYTKRRVWLFELIYPFIMNQLSYKANLDLRLVCKRWRNGVDKHFERFPSTRPLVDRGEDWSPYNDGAYVRPHFHVTFQSKEQIDTLLQKVDSYEEKSGKSNINPFVGRSVLVSASLRDNLPEEEVIEFWEQVKLLFKRCGEHIYNLEIYWNRGPLHFYQLLREIVMQSPNLRYLKLSGYITGHDLLDNYLGEVRQEMANYPLLPLPNLEYIGLDMSGLPKPIMKQLSVMYFHQLKILSTPYHDWETTSKRGLPKLEQIEFRKASCGQTILKEVPALQPAENLSWMTIYLRPDYPSDMLEMGQLMKAVAGFPNLKTFELFFSDIFQPNQPGILQISEKEIEMHKTYSVKNLQLTSFPMFRFDFLLCFPVLERLHIHMSGKDWAEYPRLPEFAKPIMASSTPIEKVEIHKWVYSKDKGGIRRSNVWNCLPKLDRFRFDLHNWDDDVVLFTQCVTRKKLNLWRKKLQQRIKRTKAKLAN